MPPTSAIKFSAAKTAPDGGSSAQLQPEMSKQLVWGWREMVFFGIQPQSL